MDKKIVINGHVLTMERRTCAEDFPLEENAKSFAESVKGLLDKKSQELLVDSLRGLSYKMQFIMCLRIMDYFLFGEIIPTGVNHVDALVKELISRFPFDHKMCELFLGELN